MVIALSIALTLAAVLIVILVLSQNGKSHGLSGTIAGGAETFFGKDKGKKADRILNTVTTVLSIAFCVVLIIMYVVQPDYSQESTPGTLAGSSSLIDTSATDEDDHDHEPEETDTGAPETDTGAPETDTGAPETDTGAPETGDETGDVDTDTAAPETELEAPVA